MSDLWSLCKHNIERWRCSDCQADLDESDSSQKLEASRNPERTSFSDAQSSPSPPPTTAEPSLEISCADDLIRVGAGHALALRLLGLDLSWESPVVLETTMRSVDRETVILDRLDFSNDAAQDLPFTVRHSGIQFFTFRIALPDTILEATFSDLVILDDRDSAGDHRAYHAGPELNVHTEGQTIADMGDLLSASSRYSKVNLDLKDQSIFTSGSAFSFGATPTKEDRSRTWLKTFRARPRPKKIRHPYPASQACLRSESGVRHVRLLSGTRWWLGRHGYVPEGDKQRIDIHLRADDGLSGSGQTSRISGNHLLFEHGGGTFTVTCHGTNGNLLNGQPISVRGMGPHPLKSGTSIRLDARRQVAELRVALMTQDVLVLARIDKLAAHECWVLVAESPSAPVGAAGKAGYTQEDADRLRSLGLPPLAHFAGGFWELPSSPDAAPNPLDSSQAKPLGPTDLPSTFQGGAWLPAAHPEVM